MDIGPLEITIPELPLQHHREGLNRKCFVEFDDVDLRQLEAGQLQGARRGGHGTDTYDLRLHASQRPAGQPHEKCEALSLCRLAMRPHKVPRRRADRWRCRR